MSHGFFAIDHISTVYKDGLGVLIGQSLLALKKQARKTIIKTKLEREWRTLMPSFHRTLEI